jgi:hypothetical protein
MGHVVLEKNINYTYFKIMLWQFILAFLKNEFYSVNNIRMNLIVKEGMIPSLTVL